MQHERDLYQASISPFQDYTIVPRSFISASAQPISNNLYFLYFVFVFREYLHVLQDSKRYMTHPAVQVQLTEKTEAEIPNKLIATSQLVCKVVACRSAGTS